MTKALRALFFKLENAKPGSVSERRLMKKIIAVMSS